MKLRNRRALIYFIKGLKFKIGAEVGVRTGQFSKFILENTDMILYSIDPWEDNQELSNANEVYNFAVNLLKPFGERSIMVKGYSPKICTNFQDNSLDFVYIDGLHTYEAVKSDLEAWCDKVRVGGIISGHDYCKEDWVGVVNAVDEFVLKYNLELNITGTDGEKPINPNIGRAKEVKTGDIGEFDGYQPSWWFYKT